MGDDAWIAGDRYDPFMGRWSRLVAPPFVAWLAQPAGLRWVDLGCGTGALSAAVLAGAEPTSVTGVDPSDVFVTWAAAHVTDPRASFAVGEAATLPGGSADVVVSGLVVNFLPDAPQAVAAMAAAARGGTVAAYVWDYSGGMQMLHLFWEAAASVDSGAAELHEAARFAGWDTDRLAALWEEAGLADVRTTSLTVEHTDPDVATLWAPFLGGTGPAPSYLAGLAPDARTAVHDSFRDRLPVAGDGTVTLSARAYAVRGRA